MSTEALNQLANVLKCGICTEFFNTPYVLSCGHTFCGECLLQWLPRSMTCPQCRSPVICKPYCSFTIRDALSVVLQSAPGMNGRPVSEPSAEQELDIKLQALKYEPAGPQTYDDEDQVQRCIHCHWEIEDGRCWRCNPEDSDESGSDGFWSDNVSEVSFRPNSGRPVIRGLNTIDSEDDSEHSSDRAFVDDDELEDHEENEFHNFGMSGGSDDEIVELNSDPAADSDEDEIIELLSEEDW